jgi:hypothetical protein
MGKGSALAKSSLRRLTEVGRTWRSSMMERPLVGGAPCRPGVWPPPFASEPRSVRARSSVGRPPSSPARTTGAAAAQGRTSSSSSPMTSGCSAPWLESAGDDGGAASNSMPAGRTVEVGKRKGVVYKVSLENGRLRTGARSVVGRGESELGSARIEPGGRRWGCKMRERTHRARRRGRGGIRSWLRWRERLWTEK